MLAGGFQESVGCRLKQRSSSTWGAVLHQILSLVSSRAAGSRCSLRRVDDTVVAVKVAR